jgi:hypothetical protein
VYSHALVLALWGNAPIRAASIRTFILSRIGLDSSLLKACRVSSVKLVSRATRSTRKSWSTDRAALDWALSRGFECGGWCPKGHKAEDGWIAKRYPLIELFKDSIAATACLPRLSTRRAEGRAGIGVTVDEEKLALYRRGRS